MAIIAKFISYDGGIAFSENVMQIKKSEDTPPARIPISDISALNIRRPQEDADGFIRVSTVDGQRHRIFFEEDQLREAVRFKKRFDALLSDFDEEDDAAPPIRSSKARSAKQSDNRRRSESGNVPLPMTTWKLVSGLLSIVLSLFVLFQSFFAGLGNAIEANNEISGSAGALVAVLMLVSGIISIIARKGNKGGNIALTILFSLAAVIGFAQAGSYFDLKIWSSWCLLCAVLALLSLLSGIPAAPQGPLGGRAKPLLILVGYAVLVAVLIFLFSGTSRGTPEPAGETNVSSGTSAGVTQPQGDTSTASIPAGGPAQLGDYTVEIKDAYKSTNYEGNPVIVINYTWTNNSSDTTCAELAFSKNAFQDGIQLDTTGLVDDPEASWTDIQPGTTLDVNAVFLLRSESPVEFQLGELFSFSDQTVKKTFDLSSIS